jgi:hypothetical protein
MFPLLTVPWTYKSERLAESDRWGTRLSSRFFCRDHSAHRQHKRRHYRGGCGYGYVATVEILALEILKPIDVQASPPLQRRRRGCTRRRHRGATSAATATTRGRGWCMDDHIDALVDLLRNTGWHGFSLLYSNKKNHHARTIRNRS